MKAHERFVTDALAQAGGDTSMAELKEFHERQLRNMQHERLIHLIVTLNVSTYFLLVIGFVAIHPMLPAFALAALLFALVCAYVVHYSAWRTECSAGTTSPIASMSGWAECPSATSHRSRRDQIG